MIENIETYVDKDMETAISVLSKKFEKIKAQGWIRGLSKGTGNIGETLEQLLGKENENFPIDDFMGIEINCNSNDCKTEYIALFSAAPYGKDFIESHRLFNEYGNIKENIPDNKSLTGSVFATFTKYIGERFRYRLLIDNKERKIKLLVFDKNDVLLDDYAYWPFEIIEQKLRNKLKYVALIKADRYYCGKYDYFKYTDLKIYKLLSISRFIWLIKTGYISIIFKMDLFKKGPKKGQIHDRGTTFQIRERDFEKLFKRIL